MAKSRTHLRPDALTGSVLAFEGLRGAVAVINAPSGCKFGTGFRVDTQDPREATLDPMEYGGEFFLGQARVPCTNLEERDYIQGSRAKLSRLLQHLESRGYGLIGVVNGPGTSLIGDNLAGIARDAGISTTVVPIESSGFTGTLADGFQDATLALLKRLDPPRVAVEPASVNLIGLTLDHPYWAHERRELERLLALSGVRINTLLSASTALEELARIGAASLNVIIHEEYGNRIAAWLEERFGTPSLSLDILPPYGITATEQWAEEILTRLGLPHEPFQAHAREISALLHRTLSRFCAVTGLPGGSTFAVFGEASRIGPLLLYLGDYLGMIPTAVGLHETAERSEDFLRTYLKRKGIDVPVRVRPDQYEIEEMLLAEKPDVILGSHYERAIARRLWNCPPGFVGMASPLWGSPRLTFRPLSGMTGCLTLVEELLAVLETRAPGALVR